LTEPKLALAFLSGEYHLRGNSRGKILATTITATVREVSDTLTWTNGDQGYTPAIHPGATFNGIGSGSSE
jgi:hypothetical protein